MKKFIILLPALLSFQLSFAQIEYSFNNNMYFWPDIVRQYGISSPGIYSLAYLTKDSIPDDLKFMDKKTYRAGNHRKKPQPQSESRSFYENGKIKSLERLKKGKSHYSYLCQYDKNAMMTHFEHHIRGRVVEMENLQFNDQGKLLQLEQYGKNHKFKKKVLRSYDQQGRLINEKIFYRNTSIPTYEWHYTYDENGRLKRNEFFKKGKLRSVWDYTCDREGKEVSKSKVDEKNICVITEHNNDGSYVKIVRTTDDKGRVVKNRSTYNSDSLLIAREIINRKGKIRHKYTREYDSEGRLVKHLTYKNAKDVKSYIVLQYDKEGRIISQSDHKGNGKLKKKYTKTYNAVGQLIDYAWYNEKNEVVKRITYKYNNRGAMIASKEFGKKNKPLKERIIELEYN